MKLESQVCSLELAKKLDELHKARGIEGESYFVWLEASDGARLLKNPVLDTYKYFARFPAFTTAELGEMLPSHVSINGQVLPVTFPRGDQKWRCQIRSVYQPAAHTEADARAKCLIYLLESNLI